MIKRKLFVEKEEKPKAVRQKRIKIDLDAMQPAVVEGKFIVPVKGKIFFERTLNGTKRVHEGHVTEIGEKGLIHVFDETVEQFYVFDYMSTKAAITKS